jgi:hypothetical protein
MTEEDLERDDDVIEAENYEVRLLLSSPFKAIYDIR